MNADRFRAVLGSGTLLGPFFLVVILRRCTLHKPLYREGTCVALRRSPYEMVKHSCVYRREEEIIVE